jgi:lysine biosynthesis protein LysW
MEAEKPIIGTCPACDTRIRLKTTSRLGQFVTCPECENMLEIINLSPVKFDWAFDEPFEEEDDFFDDDMDDDMDDDYYDDEDDEPWG